MNSFRCIFGVVFIVSVMTMGFGCKKTTSTPMPLPKPVVQSPIVTPPPQVQEIPKPKPMEQTDTKPNYEQDVRYLQSVMKSLAQANSYRASLFIALPNGIARGEAEFVRGTALHATLRIPNLAPSETFITPNTVWFRSGTSTWSQLEQDDANLTRAMFTSSFAATHEGSTTVISETARIKEITDDPLECKRYSFTQYTAQGNKIPLELCVRDGLPVRLKSTNSGATVEIGFTDINQPITLSLPVL